MDFHINISPWCSADMCEYGRVLTSQKDTRNQDKIIFFFPECLHCVLFFAAQWFISSLGHEFSDQVLPASS